MTAPKVLVILDDGEVHRRQMGKRVRAEGFAVHTASSVDEFTKIVRAEHIDYALVDLKVDYRGTFGGLAALSHLKRHQPWSKVIVVTGQPPGDTEKLAASHGADAYVYKLIPGNYIEAVMAKLREFEKLAPRQLCFCVMPMSGSESCSESEWTAVFEQMVKPALESAGYQCRRSSGVVGNIIKQVLDDLNRAEMVIADLTDRNANVFYELGVRHALRDSTILIAQSMTHVPFDLRPYGVVVYDWKTPEGRAKFELDIAAAVAICQANPARAASPVYEYLHPERSAPKTGTVSSGRDVTR